MTYRWVGANPTASGNKLVQWSKIQVKVHGWVSRQRSVAHSQHNRTNSELAIMFPAPLSHITADSLKLCVVNSWLDYDDDNNNGCFFLFQCPVKRIAELMVFAMEKVVVSAKLDGLETNATWWLVTSDVRNTVSVKMERAFVDWAGMEDTVHYVSLKNQCLLLFSSLFFNLLFFFYFPPFSSTWNLKLFMMKNWDSFKHSRI